MDEGPHLVVVLAPHRRLDPARHVDSIGPDLAHVRAPVTGSKPPGDEYLPRYRQLARETPTPDGSGAGRLEPGNVGTVVSQIKPYGVDVSSGVEASVRVKDHDKVRAFVHAVRLAEILS